MILGIICFSLVLCIVGYATGFNTNVDEDVIWTPKDSRSIKVSVVVVVVVAAAAVVVAAANVFFSVVCIAKIELSLSMILIYVCFFSTFLFVISGSTEIGSKTNRALSNRLDLLS